MKTLWTHTDYGEEHAKKIAKFLWQFRIYFFVEEHMHQGPNWIPYCIIFLTPWIPYCILSIVSTKIFSIERREERSCRAVWEEERVRQPSLGLVFRSVTSPAHFAHPSPKVSWQVLFLSSVSLSTAPGHPHLSARRAGGRQRVSFPIPFLLRRVKRSLFFHPYPAQASSLFWFVPKVFDEMSCRLLLPLALLTCFFVSLRVQALGEPVSRSESWRALEMSAGEDLCVCLLIIDFLSSRFMFTFVRFSICCNGQELWIPIPCYLFSTPWLTCNMVLLPTFD
jgi:hypothetical protein